MKFYAYVGAAPLGAEPLGTENKLLFELKTTQGAKRRCVKAFGSKPYQLYTYTNVYDNNTYKAVTK